MFLPLQQGLPFKTRYDSLAREGYMQNSVVNACIREISHAAAGVPWELFRRLGDGRLEKIDSHPLLELIKKPNPFQGQFEFLEKCFSHLYLSGNAYIEAVTLPGVKRVAGTLLAPDRLRVVVAGKPEGLAATK